MTVNGNTSSWTIREVKHLEPNHFQLDKAFSAQESKINLPALNDPDEGAKVKSITIGQGKTSGSVQDLFSSFEQGCNFIDLGKPTKVEKLQNRPTFFFSARNSSHVNDFATFW